MDNQHVNMNPKIDDHKKERLDFWSKRLTSPVLIALDNNFQKVLSGDFVERMNPEAYRIPKEAVALLLCSDERLNNLNLEKMFEKEREGKPIFPVRLPGAVVDQDVDELKEKFKDYDFYKLAAASHADCGAAGTDQHAKDLVSNLEEIEDWGFIDKEDDPELNGIHSAGCLLFDGTGKRNYLSDGVLPEECFMLNRAVYSDPELAKSHIDILTKIALGDHGLGSLFSKEHPFYIFVSALDNGNLIKYMDEAEEAVKSFPEGLVKVVGFQAPRVD